MSHQLPSEVFYDHLADVPLPPRGTFADGVQRPTAGRSAIKYFALTDSGETKIEGDAVGVAMERGKLVIAVAIFDVQASLTPRAFAEAWNTSKAAQHDFFYTGVKTACKYQARCTRRDCTFFHNRRGEDQYLGFSVRTTPPEMKHMDGLGLQHKQPSHAVVMKATFRCDDGDDVSRVNFAAPMSVEFSIEAVTLSHPLWTDDALERNSCPEMAYVKTFCEAVSGVPEGFTYESLFAATRGVKEAQANFDVPQQRWLLNLTRDAFSLRRFLTDVTLDYFNEQALAFLGRSSQRRELHLLGKVGSLDDIRGASGYFSDLPALPNYRMGRHFLTPRMVLGAMQTTATVYDASDRAAQKTDGTMKYFKFTSPLRDFMCLHNLSVLAAAVTGSRPPEIFSARELAVMSKRRGVLEHKERGKVRHAIDTRDRAATGPLLDVAVRLDDELVYLVQSGTVAKLALVEPFCAVQLP